MTNYEKHKDVLMKMLGGTIGVVNGVPFLCKEIKCSQCSFKKEACLFEAYNWLNQEAEE